MLKITSTLCVNHLAMQHISTNISNMSTTSQEKTHQMMTSQTIHSKNPASARMAQKPVNHEKCLPYWHILACGLVSKISAPSEISPPLAWLELIFRRGAILNLICQATGVAQIRQALGRRSCGLKKTTFFRLKKNRVSGAASIMFNPLFVTITGWWFQPI